MIIFVLFQPQVAVQGKVSPQKSSLSYCLHHQLFVNESPVQHGHANLEISRNKQTYKSKIDNFFLCKYSLDFS